MILRQHGGIQCSDHIEESQLITGSPCCVSLQGHVIKSQWVSRITEQIIKESLYSFLTAVPGGEDRRLDATVDLLGSPSAQ
jgi:hypothetical protein